MELNDLTAQRRYAAWLAWGTRLGLTALVLTFVAYVAGWLASHVPIERLPVVWSRPASELLVATGVSAGWGWARLLPASDMLVLLAISVLSTCSVACLAAVTPAFAARGERTLAVVCVAIIAVLLLAASGFLASGH